MGFHRRSGGAWPEIGNVRRRSGGGWAQVQTVRRRQGGAWVEVWNNYVPLDGNRGIIGGDVFRPEPAPAQFSVSATGAAGATGGTGSYSYVWTVIAGDATITGSNTSASVTIIAMVLKNSETGGVIRCHITDGITAIDIDRTYALTYTTDL